MLALLAAPLFAALAPAAGQVWVATDTPSLLAALAGSAHGDIVLLKAGVYAHTAPFAISGKAVSLVADAGAVVEFQRQLEVSGNPTGATCLLQGIQLHSTVSAEAALMAVTVSAPLWIERCSVRNASVPGSGPLPAAAYLVGCQRVVLHASTFIGADGQSAGFLGAYALDLFQSLVSAYGIDVRGGKGRDATASFSAVSGARGLLAMDGQFFAQGSTIRGGAGGNAFAGVVCQAAGVGGPGADLLLFQNPPPFHTLDTQVQGGAGGAGSGPCPAGAAGPAYAGSTANLHTYAGTARELTVTSPVREGQTLLWSLQGVPGDLAFVAYGLAPLLGYPDVTAAGVLALQAPFQVAFAGVVPPSGTQTGGVALNELGPGVEGVILFVQSGYFDGARAWFGAPSASLLLDQAF